MCPNLYKEAVENNNNAREHGNVALASSGRGLMWIICSIWNNGLMKLHTVNTKKEMPF